MSRPSSAASSHRLPTRPSTAPTYTVPFTPRPKHQPRDKRNPFNDDELDHIAETLASVRKVDRHTIRQQLEISPEDIDPDQSYNLEESKYRTRPLTSRVTSTATIKTNRTVSSNSVAQLDNPKRTERKERADRIERSREISEDVPVQSDETPRPNGVEVTRTRPVSSIEIRRQPSTSLSGPSRTERIRRERATDSAIGSSHSSRPTSRAGRYAASDKGKQRESRVVDYIANVPSEDEEPLRTSSTDKQSQEIEERKLDGVPLAVQEAWVCEDLRFVLQGVQGEIIQFAKDYDPTDELQRLRGTRWIIDPSLDPSLRNVTEKILPLATFYTAVKAFIELRNDVTFGMVNHALASGIRGILRDYNILTAKLESLYLTSPDFTLQSAFQYLHPTLHILSLLYATCLALDHDPFPEYDESSQEDEEEENEEDQMARMMAQELGLDLHAMGLANKKEREEEAAKGNILGGEVLGVIVERAAATSGDPAAHSLFSSVLLHASQPYARMLIKWITTGILKDPYDEFLIKEDSGIDKDKLVTDYSDEYWERRYTLRDGSSLAMIGKSYSDMPMQAFIPACRPGTERLPGGACIPPFLEAWKFKILLAGKYLNVIKECGVEIADWEQKDREIAEQDEDTMVRMDQPKFHKRIEMAYYHSNRTLLDLILREKELLPNLKSMKHFFFLDQSEFLNQFFDNAHLELKKPSASSSLTKIQSLLYMAVSNPASATSLDPQKEQLRVVMSTQPLFDWLQRVVSKKVGDGLLAAVKGSSNDEREEAKKKEKTMLTIDALAFDFDVPFPLSLVISRKAVTRYQLIFRFLLALRYLEFCLSNIWIEHKQPEWRKSTGSPDVERWKRRVYILRAKMLQWVQHMLGFVTGDVLETNWKKLEENLTKVSTIDQLLRDHVDYLDNCLKECTLTSEKLINVTSKIMTTITTFTNHHVTLSRTLTKYIEDPRGYSTEEKIAARWSILQKFEDHWKVHCITHLDTVTYMASSETPVFLALVARLTPLHDPDQY